MCQLRHRVLCLTVLSWWLEDDPGFTLPAKGMGLGWLQLQGSVLSS